MRTRRSGDYSDSDWLRPLSSFCRVVFTSMEQRKRSRPDDYFKDWKQREALAEGMIPLVGQLYREHNVKTPESG